MRRFLMMGLLLVGLAGCEDDDGGILKTDGPSGVMDAAMEMSAAAETGTDTLPAARSPLERPTDLPRPPNGRLPVDLLPPTR